MQSALLLWDTNLSRDSKVFGFTNLGEKVDLECAIRWVSRTGISLVFTSAPKLKFDRTGVSSWFFFLRPSVHVVFDISKTMLIPLALWPCESRVWFGANNVWGSFCGSVIS